MSDNLTKIVSLMDEMFRADRYGSFAASMTGSYSFSIAGGILGILERQDQLSEMDERGVDLNDLRRSNVGDWIKTMETRMERNAELYGWFKSIAVNENSTEFASTKAKDILERMRNPQVPEIDEITHQAKLKECSLVEAKEQIMAAMEKDAEKVGVHEDEITPWLQKVLDDSISSEVVELDDNEARRIAEALERKAEQYAHNIEDLVDRTRGRTARQRRYKETLVGSMKILEALVKEAGEFADKLSHDLEAGEKREGEMTYDTLHGSKEVIS